MDINKLTDKMKRYREAKEKAIQQHFMLMGAEQAIADLIEEEEKDGKTETTDVPGTTDTGGPERSGAPD